MLKKFFSDFKEFAMKGNIIDMALGVVIGSAFGKIVSSFVADVITPFISLITGNVNLTDLKAVLRPAVDIESAWMRRWYYTINNMRMSTKIFAFFFLFSDFCYFSEGNGKSTKSCSFFSARP